MSFRDAESLLIPRLRALVASRPKLARALAALLGVVALVGVAGLVAPWTFSTMALIQEIARQMQASSGLFIAARGRTTFSPFPRPHIDVSDIAFADPNGALVIEAEALHGNVAILPLLLGRLEIGETILVRPRIDVDLDRRPLAAAGAASRAAAAPPATVEAQKADNARLGIVVVKDGALRVKQGGEERRFEHLAATLDWPRIGASATLTARFDWRGDHPQIVVWVARPGPVLRGDSSPVTVRVSSDSLRFEAEGIGQMGAKPRYSARLSASSPSLRQALALFGLAAPLPGPFENVELESKAVFGPREAQLFELRLVADDNRFDGSLLLRFEEGRPILRAALASPFVSLKPMLVDAPALTGPDGHWSREPLALPDLSGADVEVKLDAAHARISRFALSDAALSMTLRDGRLDLALSGAGAYKGSATARATLLERDGGVQFQGSIETRGVDAGGVLWDAAGRQDLRGQLDATITLDSFGDTVASLMRRLDGRASVALTQGELIGIDLERALRRIDKRPLSSALDIRRGRSQLDRAAATFVVAGGVAAVEDGVARGPGFALAFSGAVKVAERSVAITAQASEADAAGRPRDGGAHIGFDVTGGFDEFALAPDAQALIRQSGAAAPLLPAPPLPPAQKSDTP